MTIHGILPVLKPKGYTSHDIVAKVRRLVGQKRVGHTGTLDPEVEGVLPVCLGQATRVVEYIQELPKTYRGSFVLGISTDTEDQMGTILQKIPVTDWSIEQIQEVFNRFHGEIEQVPPMYSAVKVKGKRLYELARKGEQVERPVRRVQVYDLKLLDVSMEQEAHPCIHFEVVCSKGTYVRTLCVDLGKALGYPAHMNALQRVKSGPFGIEDCYTLAQLEQVANENHWSHVVLPIDQGLLQMPSLIIRDQEAKHVLNGKSLRLPEAQRKVEPNSLIRVYVDSGLFLAIYRVVEQGWAKPEKVFRDVES